MDELSRAKNAAAKLLVRRMYSCSEIFDRLCRKGFNEEIAEQTVAEFMKLGYLDDRKFAEYYITDAVNLGSKGIYRIRQELRRRGVSASVIDAALEESEADTKSALREYIEQRNLCDNVHSYKDLEKLKAKLVRRGYSLSEIRECLSEYEFEF